MNLELTNKKAFVNGSTSGIGFAIAKQLLQEGAEVIINGRNEKSIGEAVDKLKASIPNAKVSGIAADYSKRETVEQLIAQLENIDILINNVGIYGPSDFVNITDEDWYRFFEINVMSGIRLSRSLFPKMLKKDWGRIIFITSESASNIPDEMIHYGVTKASSRIK